MFVVLLSLPPYLCQLPWPVSNDGTGPIRSTITTKSPVYQQFRESVPIMESTSLNVGETEPGPSLVTTMSLTPFLFHLGLLRPYSCESFRLHRLNGSKRGRRRYPVTGILSLFSVELVHEWHLAPWLNAQWVGKKDNTSPIIIGGKRSTFFTSRFSTF